MSVFVRLSIFVTFYFDEAFIQTKLFLMNLFVYFLFASLSTHFFFEKPNLLLKQRVKNKKVLVGKRVFGLGDEMKRFRLKGVN